MHIRFIGAAQEVTGSCFLIETEGLRFLVDCGMRQGGREAREARAATPRGLPLRPNDAHPDTLGAALRICQDVRG